MSLSLSSHGLLLSDTKHDLQHSGASRSRFQGRLSQSLDSSQSAQRMISKMTLYLLEYQNIKGLYNAYFNVLFFSYFGSPFWIFFFSEIPFVILFLFLEVPLFEFSYFRKFSLLEFYFQKFLFFEFFYFRKIILLWNFTLVFKSYSI